MQHWIDCMQFFYIIFAVLLKHHGVNNRHYYLIKDCQWVYQVTYISGLVVNMYTTLRCLQYYNTWLNWS